jgi:hypothetical protein
MKNDLLEIFGMLAPNEEEKQILSDGKSNVLGILFNLAD